jgi:hypothetical protein
LDGGGVKLHLCEQVDVLRRGRVKPRQQPSDHFGLLEPRQQCSRLDELHPSPALRIEPRRDVAVQTVRLVVVDSGPRAHPLPEDWPKKNASTLFQLFLCLSRACRGQMVVFHVKMAPKVAFFAPVDHPGSVDDAVRPG